MPKRIHSNPSVEDQSSEKRAKTESGDAPLSELSMAAMENEQTLDAMMQETPVEEPMSLAPDVDNAIEVSTSDVHSQLVVSSSSSSALVSSASTAVSFGPLHVYCHDEMMDNPSQEEYMKKFWTIMGYCRPLLIQGVRVINPDLALYLFLRHAKSNCAGLDFNESRHVSVTRSEGKNKVNGRLVGNGTFYINLGSKSDAKVPGLDLNKSKLNIVTPFARTLYTRYGPTIETGLDGNKGKSIKGKVVANGQEKYDILMTTKPYHDSVKDADENNPIQVEFQRAQLASEKRLLRQMVANPLMLVDMRKDINKSAGRILSDEEMYEALLLDKNTNFKINKTSDEGDETATQMTINRSCYRMIFEEQDSGAPAVKSANPYPSPMFVKNKERADGKQQVHNPIPVYRFRRHDEVVEGVEYKSILIRIPDEEAVITNDDVISVDFIKGVYEYQLNADGYTNKQACILWLNNQQALDAIATKDIVPCDPTKCMPMAGYYMGLNGWVGGAPPGWVEPAKASASSSTAEYDAFRTG